MRTSGIYINTYNCEMMRGAEGEGKNSEILSFRSVFFSVGGGMWGVYVFYVFMKYMLRMA